MSSAAPVAPMARNPSTRRQQPLNGPADTGVHRSHSTAVRSTAQPPSSPHRSQSQSYRPTSSPQQPGDLAHVDRRDFEQSNVADPTSHRTSRDQAPDRTASVRRSDRRYDPQYAHDGTVSR